MSLASSPGGDSAVGLETLLNRARTAQRDWARRAVRDRLAILRRVRRAIGSRPESLADLVEVPSRRDLAESLVVEVLPLLDAIRFLEREAGRLLAPRRLGRRGRPLAFMGMDAEVHRRARGVVLVLGPSNYPLMLPGVHAVQALCAGNAVVVKPGAGGGRALESFAAALTEAGLPSDLFVVLDESLETGRAVVDAGFDHVVLTGAHETGRAVLARLASGVTPATMELSGTDACYVREDADVALAARALRFGLELNGGATCIAPRRAFVARSLVPELEAALKRELLTCEALPAAAPRAARVRELFDDALERGARVVAGEVPELGRLGPLVLSDVPPDARLLVEDHFGPMLALIAVDSDHEALELDGRCPFALGASIFSRDEAAARDLAARVRAGSVTINDCVAPTGDPRLPFGGQGASGFGSTRGAEGLLALTTPQAVTVTRGRRRHLDPVEAGAQALFSALIRLMHGGTDRLAAFRDLMTAGRRYGSPESKPPRSPK